MDSQNQAWAKDTSRFGYRMLQQMGWAEGDGLGTRGDGVTKHVVLRRKRDNAGIGAGSIPAHQWRAHAEASDHFDGILSRLGAVGNTPIIAAPPTESAAKRRKRPPELREKDAEVQRAPAEKRGSSYFARRRVGKDVQMYSEAHKLEIFGKPRLVHSSPPAEHAANSLLNGKQSGSTPVFVGDASGGDDDAREGFAVAGADWSSGRADTSRNDVDIPPEARRQEKDRSKSRREKKR